MSVLALLKAESSMQSTEVHLHYFFRTEIVSPNLTCWLTGVQINCSCGEWFHDYDDPCLSGPDSRQTVHFFATKEPKRCPLMSSGLCCKQTNALRASPCYSPAKPLNLLKSPNQTT